jgi:hypothetical protein
MPSAIYTWTALIAKQEWVRRRNLATIPHNIFPALPTGGIPIMTGRLVRRVSEVGGVAGVVVEGDGGGGGEAK